MFILIMVVRTVSSSRKLEAVSDSAAESSSTMLAGQSLTYRAEDFLITSLRNRQDLASPQRQARSLKCLLTKAQYLRKQWLTAGSSEKAVAGAHSDSLAGQSGGCTEALLSSFAGCDEACSSDTYLEAGTTNARQVSKDAAPRIKLRLHALDNCIWY